MRIPSTLLMGLAATVLVFGLARVGTAAYGISPAQDPDEQEQEQEPETELARQMEIVKDGLRSLRRSVRDPAKKADSLAAVIACERAIVAAKSEVPSMAAQVPEAEREAFVTAFRLEMLGLLENFLVLEKALLEGRNDELRDLYKVLKGLEDPAHERFTEDG
ncbi:MAG: hypothetical protein V3T22_10700 [Planctomycetota bacterium]